MFLIFPRLLSRFGVRGFLHSFNPGLVDPTNPVWNNSRRPLAAVWESSSQANTGFQFFTVNVHFTSKDGSGSIQSNARPPVNSGVQLRSEQVNVVSVRTSFTLRILREFMF